MKFQKLFNNVQNHIDSVLDTNEKNIKDIFSTNDQIIKSLKEVKDIASKIINKDRIQKKEIENFLNEFEKFFKTFFLSYLNYHELFTKKKEGKEFFEEFKNKKHLLLPIHALFLPEILFKEIVSEDEYNDIKSKIDELIIKGYRPTLDKYKYLIKIFSERLERNDES